MPNKELVDAVGRYIDKYYVPGTDDIKLDKEMKSIFDKISDFRNRRAKIKLEEEKKTETDTDFEIDERAAIDFDVSSMKKTKFTKTMSSTMATNRNIDDLMNQIEETFSQRLLRMIDERGMSDSEVYNNPRKYPYLNRAIVQYARENNCSYDDALILAKTGKKTGGASNEYICYVRYSWLL